MKNVAAQFGVQMNWFAGLAGIFCLAMATSASAQQSAGPCAEDVARLCQGVQQGGGKIAKCLREHSNDLSTACKGKTEEMEEKLEDFKQACKDDAVKFCKGENPGEGRVLRCLKRNDGALSPACKAKMEKT